MKYLEVIDESLDGQAESDILGATLKGIMIAYANRWDNAKWETKSVEESFHLDIINPETGRKSRTFTHAGKYDGIVTFEGKDFLLEHKTCSEDIADPNAPYWRRLAIDAQISGYVLSQWQQGNKLDGTLYDVIRKPKIRPRALTKAEVAGVVGTGGYFGTHLSESCIASIIGGSIKTENAELFQARVAFEMTNDPSYYFQRRTIPRMDADIAEFAQELWDVSDEIRLARANNRHYRNPGACMNYNTACAYLPICSGFDTPDSNSWKKKTKTHEELPIDDGLNILSHSRIACFKTCRAKHFYEYELGIKPNKEEKEALYFGRLLHLALAEYWLQRQVQEVI